MSADGKIPVSLLILTLNEAGNIERCMESLSWSDDIVVLDSYSQDDTVERAQSRGAQVHQRAFDNFANQRNFALDNFPFKHEWVLHLDADEIVTPELRDEIRRVTSNPGCKAYRIASKLMFMGKWLRFSGMYPSYQVRLGEKQHLRFEQVGHGQRETLDSAQVGTLQSALLHYGFSRGLADWIERHNRYSSDEAVHGLQVLEEGGLRLRDLLSRGDRTRRRRALKRLSVRLPLRPLLRFIYVYFLRLGFLDGRAGLEYSRLLASYEYWTVLKLRELQHR